MDVRITFWGVRGSIASASPDHVVYGGNTTCIAVEVEGRLLIFDAGTGLRFLGAALRRRPMAEADLFLSHYHWDHVAGLPFFAPGYQPDFRLRIHGPRLTSDRFGVRDALTRQMEPPGFPVPLSAMRGIAAITDFEAGAALIPAPGLILRTAALNHPGGACGFRLEAAGAVVAIVLDTEHVPGQTDPAVLALIDHADLMIYDSTYTEPEFRLRQGWGHSTWQEGVRLAGLAGVGQLVLCHHDPDHDDRMIAAIEAAAIALRPGTLAAREGMMLELKTTVLTE